ncbi:hypothetical protein F3Y22_tig00111338pilonHSYRG00219 [Hibiscus syriacus]|uniref:F-box domain-containing protein n=1 Tax=Hibiscus syriacus TaxID=106335 RepID=A0A6A2YP92_HIBSY|nr:hypothetical protein F3Y22_tig00111338pilonHSYRG00219 [Hibiscus syriacus]
MKEEAPNEMMTLEDFLAKSRAVEEEEEVKLHGRNHERRETRLCFRFKKIPPPRDTVGIGSILCCAIQLAARVLSSVFSFLDHHNLCNDAMICRQWRSTSAHEDFWRNLEALTLGKGLLGDAFFHAMTECGMLRSLDVNDAILGDGGQEIPINHDRLCDMKVTKYGVMRISIRCPLLMSLSLKRSNMAPEAFNCPLLQLLDISACHKLTDASIHSVVTSCPQLESLDMSNFLCVSDETLQEIAHSCSVLHVLNSSYCPNISLELLEDSLEERLEKAGGFLTDSEKTEEENKVGDVDETMDYEVTV